MVSGGEREVTMDLRNWQYERTLHTNCTLCPDESHLDKIRLSFILSALTTFPRLILESFLRIFLI